MMAPSCATQPDIQFAKRLAARELAGDFLPADGIDAMFTNLLAFERRLVEDLPGNSSLARPDAPPVAQPRQPRGEPMSKQEGDRSRRPFPSRSLVLRAQGRGK